MKFEKKLQREDDPGLNASNIARSVCEDTSRVNVNDIQQPSSHNLIFHTTNDVMVDDKCFVPYKTK